MVLTSLQHNFITRKELFFIFILPMLTLSFAHLYGLEVFGSEVRVTGSVGQSADLIIAETSGGSTRFAVEYDGRIYAIDDLVIQSGTGFNGTIGHTITSSRTWTLPDATGTVVLNDNTATLTGKIISCANNTCTITMAQLSDVTDSSCSDGQILEFQSSNSTWICSASGSDIRPLNNEFTGLNNFTSQSNFTNTVTINTPDTNNIQTSLLWNRTVTMKVGGDLSENQTQQGSVFKSFVPNYTATVNAQKTSLYGEITTDNDRTGGFNIDAVAISGDASIKGTNTNGAVWGGEFSANAKFGSADGNLRGAEIAIQNDVGSDVAVMQEPKNKVLLQLVSLGSQNITGGLEIGASGTGGIHQGIWALPEDILDAFINYTGEYEVFQNGTQDYNQNVLKNISQLNIGTVVGTTPTNFYIYEDTGDGNPQIFLEQDGIGDVAINLALTNQRAWRYGIDNSEGDDPLIIADANNGFAAGNQILKLVASDNSVHIMTGDLEMETNNISNLSELKFNSLTDATRPACIAGLEGTVIYNSDDKTLNLCDGTNWKYMNGTVT